VVCRRITAIAEYHWPIELPEGAVLPEPSEPPSLLEKWAQELRQRDKPDGQAVILDPSFLFSDDALAWLLDPEIQPWLVVSAAAARRLRDPRLLNYWREFGPVDRARLALLQQAVRPIGRFSYRDREDVSPENLSIRQALVEDGPLGEIFADEWIFLTTQSVGVFALWGHHSLNRFRRAKAQVIDVPREQMLRGLEAIEEHLPPWLLPGMKRFGHFPHRRVPQVIVLGGTIAALFVPAVGLPMGIVGAVQQGSAILAGDP
jgi:hypothetical protein